MQYPDTNLFFRTYIKVSVEFEAYNNIVELVFIGVCVVLKQVLINQKLF